MNSSQLLQLIGGIVAGLSTLPFLIGLGKLFGLQVEDEETVLVTRFGKLEKTLNKPGWHWVPERVLPWVRTFPVSRARDFRDITNIQVNDARGTTVIVDLWLEFRVADPARALFGVADWDKSLRALVTHAALSILGNRSFEHILCDRSELGEKVRQDIQDETQRWGLEVERVLIRNVSLRPEVAQQVFDTLSARLERATAEVEEEGRQRVALLDAQTSAQVAALVAEAKGQYPAAVGRAFSVLGKQPRVLHAYNELYSLSQVRPHRTVAFHGFEGDSLRAVDVAMIPTTTNGTQELEVPALRPNGDERKVEA
jgi:regulator of protease activity HflC (stomatin/prohibitin superfamily)